MTLDNSPSANDSPSARFSLCARDSPSANCSLSAREILPPRVRFFRCELFSLRERFSLRAIVTDNGTKDLREKKRKKLKELDLGKVSDAFIGYWVWAFPDNGIKWVYAMLRMEVLDIECFGSCITLQRLSYDTNEPVLKDAFGKHGAIIEGYGFVKFTSETEASSALKEMDVQVLDGRQIRLQFAHKG
ncbi:hypothetical protein ACLB2K_031215 [Fragaria x ananassa]